MDQVTKFILANVDDGEDFKVPKAFLEVGAELSMRTVHCKVSFQLYDRKIVFTATRDFPFTVLDAAGEVVFSAEDGREIMNEVLKIVRQAAPIMDVFPSAPQFQKARS